MQNEKRLISKLQKDFPDLDVVVLNHIKAIFDRLVRISYRLNKTEPSDEKVNALVAHIKSFIYMSLSD